MWPLLNLSLFGFWASNSVQLDVAEEVFSEPSAVPEPGNPAAKVCIAYAKNCPGC